MMVIEVVFIKTLMILDDLYKIIKERIKMLPDNSYVAKLYKEGDDRILQKMGEESVEVIIAATNKNKKRIIEEISDLYFMTLVVMATKEIKPEDVFKELKKKRKKKNIIGKS